MNALREFQHIFSSAKLRRVGENTTKTHPELPPADMNTVEKQSVGIILTVYLI
jgi:hypothetical protein